MSERIEEGSTALGAQPDQPDEVDRRPSIPSNFQPAQQQAIDVERGIVPNDTGSSQNGEELVAASPKNSASSKHIGRSPSQRSSKDIIGTWGLVILTAGTVVLLAIMFFLTFLWARSPAMTSANPPPVWHRIVFNDWLTRTISLSSLAIRTIITLQGSFCTAMIASLLLETTGVTLDNVPQMLVLRAHWTGPTKLFFRRWKTNKAYKYSLLGLILLYSCFMVHFSSTLLLSDLGEQPIRSSTIVQNLLLGVDENDDLTSSIAIGITITPWLNPFSFFPIFSEYSEPPSDKVDDTGQVLRALLPFEDSASRSALSSFSGYSTVVQTRFVCIPPKITRFSFIPNPGSGNPSISLSFNVTAADVVSFNDSQNYTDTSMNDSNCTLPFSQPSNNSLFICQRYSTDDSHDPVMKSVFRSPSSDAHNFSSTGLVLASSFLVFNTTNNILSSGDSNTSGILEISPNSTSMEQQGPWTYLDSPFGSDFDPISVSVCYSNLIGDLLSVQLENGVGDPEPSISYNTTTSTFNTTDVVKMLIGAHLNMSLVQRGLLRLQKQDNWTANRHPNRNLTDNTGLWTDELMFNILDVVDYGYGNAISLSKTMMICSICDFSDSPTTTFSVHRTYASVFEDVYERTASLAIALQSLFSLFAQSIYYDLQPSFARGGQANASFYVTKLIPTHSAGLITVWVTVALHLLAFYAVTVIFCSRPRLARLGDYWQTFAQATTGEIGNVMAISSTADDSEVREYLRTKGVKKAPFKLVYVDDTQILEMTKKTKDE